jgi:hypothetical protein
MIMVDEEGSFDSYASFDFCDKTTWWQASSRVTDEALSSVTATVFSSANENWIDLEHGKVTFEDTIAETYAPKIYLDGVLQSSGYTINYNLGRVEFSSAPSGAVSADYSWASSSEFVLSPRAGTCLVIRKAEVQFCNDVQMSPMDFAVYGYDPSDLPNKIPYDVKTYKNIKDIINISNSGFSVPPFHGLSEGVVIFPFNYARAIFLYASKGMEIRLRIRDDQPFVGSYGTCTFYAIEQIEDV